MTKVPLISSLNPPWDQTSVKYWTPTVAVITDKHLPHHHHRHHHLHPQGPAALSPKLNAGDTISSSAQKKHGSTLKTTTGPSQRRESRCSKNCAPYRLLRASTAARHDARRASRPERRGGLFYSHVSRRCAPERRPSSARVTWGRLDFGRRPARSSHLRRLGGVHMRAHSSCISTPTSPRALDLNNVTLNSQDCYPKNKQTNMKTSVPMRVCIPCGDAGFSSYYSPQSVSAR